MRETLERFIAVDWSGDKTPSGQRKRIWFADWDTGTVTLECGRTREEVTDYLIEARKTSKAVLVGLDFAFSYPARFIERQDCSSALEFWDRVSNGKGELWLSTCEAPFWGRKGCRCPAGQKDDRFRRTEQELRAAHFNPKSPFQIGGAGAVGTGSLRGIPRLIALKDAGYSIWPFDAPKPWTVIEIYPRLFTGRGHTNNPESRASELRKNAYASISNRILTKAQNSEDAFDALCSVLGMKNHAKELANLTQETDPVLSLEGRIWRPS